MSKKQPSRRSDGEKATARIIKLTKPTDSGKPRPKTPIHLSISAQPQARSRLNEAQELIYEAWEAPTRERCVLLAHRALEISGDCADAYVLLAQWEARNLRDAIDLCQRGMEAGSRAIGEPKFGELIGEFWLHLETRPYMRACFFLAHYQWMCGRRKQAVRHLQDMLFLNPGDNQGIRYVLAARLLELREDDDLAELLSKYEKDGMAAWAYSRAALAFRQEGDTPKSRRLLREALESNPHIPEYLLGVKRLPEQMPSSYGMGDEREAICYAEDNLKGWKRSPGLLEWLSEQSGVPMKWRRKKRPS